MLLRDATLIDLDPPAVERGDLRVEGGQIVARGEALPAEGGEEVIELGGDALMPGLVNAHSHLYSALARGLPAPPVEDFGQALERICWPLDRALTLADVATSGRVGLAEAALCGTTTLVDHHASPEAIEGSLAALGGAFEAVGLRGALCYEVTDRNGDGGRDAGVAECARGLARYRGGDLRALVGLHAPFTLSDASLAALAALPGPVHVHIAEGAQDLEDARRRGLSGPLERLERAGLLREGSLLVHGVGLSDEEVARARAAGCWLVHNPTSNRNNRVGYARPGRFGDRAALGTDGIGSDMLGAFQEAFYAAREHRHEVDLLGLLTGGHRLASALLGVKLGRLRSGFAADLVRLDYRPPTPLSADTLVGHLLFGVGARHVRDVWVGGAAVVRDRALVRVDGAAIAREGAAAAGDLWRRYTGNLARG